LVALLEHNPQADDDVNPLDTVGHSETETDKLRTSLQHDHLPLLADLEVIEWNRETGEIRKGPKWKEIEPVLRLIEKHQDELPEGWL
jgi:hypothetical protein